MRMCLVCRGRAEQKSLMRICAGGSEEVLVLDRDRSLGRRGVNAHLACLERKEAQRPGLWERGLRLNPGSIGVEQLTDFLRRIYGKDSSI